MKRTWTIIGVADVPHSFSWYLYLLGLPKAEPAHDYFGQILDADGTVLLCLHRWGAHEHPEPPRVWWRLQLLREWSHEQVQQVFP
jgi:hypothetical protein